MPGVREATKRKLTYTTGVSFNWKKKTARPVWLRCPVCGYTWRAAVLTDEPQWQNVTPQSLRGEGCNRCDTKALMQLVADPEES